MKPWQRPYLPVLAVLGTLSGTAFLCPSPALAQAPPAVPALPDTERRTAYTLTSSTCPACSVGFALYGDGTDYGNWLEVWLITGSGSSAVATKLTATTDYTLSSATGSVATIPRPITDATITLATAKTGTLEIVGARRPRRISQFAENRGVAARDLNQTVTDMVAENRELWDKMSRALIATPGDSVGPLPVAAVRAGGIQCYDGTGQPLICAAGSSGTANVVGPNVSVVGHIATFANTTGTLLLDGGLVGAGDFVGPAGAATNHVVTFNGATGKIGKDSGLTLTPSTGTITLANGKTFAVDNSVELIATDGTVMTFPTTSATLARTDAGNTFTGHQTIEGVTSTGATGTGKLVFDTAPTVGALTVTSINKVTVTAPASGSTLTIADGKTLTDTSGVGASVLLGTTGGGFSAYAGATCTNQFIRVLSAAAAATCASVANTDLTNSSVTIGSTNVALGATAATVAGLTLTAPTINGGTAQALTNLGIRSSGTGAFDVVLVNTENLTAQRALTLTLNNAARAINISGNLTLGADLITAGANAITLTTTGATNITLPTSGTLATIDTAQTISSPKIFSALQQFTDIKFSSGKLYPTSDSTTALQVMKADGTTSFVTFDSTNKRVGINKTPGAFDLDVNGAVNVGTTLSFLTLDAASLALSTSTITGLTVNNSPNASNDYFAYFSAADGRIRKCTVGSCAAAATAGVQSLNGLTGALSIVAGTGMNVSAVGTSVTLASYEQPATVNNCTLAASVSANALTVALKNQAGTDPSASSPCVIAFRSATAATGDYTAVSVTAATSFATGTSLSTFGSTNSVPFRLWVVAFNNAGTVALGVINATTPTRLYGIDEDAVQSSTACSACTTATLAGTYYSTAAQTSKAIRALGYMTWESGLATAGTWASGPTNISLKKPGTPMPGTLTGNANSMACTPNTTTTNATASFVTTSASIALTPRSAANMVSVSAYGSSQLASGNAGVITGLLRGGTLIGNAQVLYPGGAAVVYSPTASSLMDFPQTTASTTWSVGVRAGSAGPVAAFGGVVGFTDSGCGISVAEIMG